MKTDALRRRLRYARPQPVDTRIELRERDFVIFEALYRHGPLPANYLFEFAKHMNRNFNAHQKRLTKLYNGTRDKTAYLVRPPQQFASFEARYQPLVYDLAPRAKHVLIESNRIAHPLPSRNDSFVHRFMTACVGASIELTAKERGIRYIPKDEIFAHPKCPGHTKKAQNPLSLPAFDGGARHLVPDDLFGLRYPEGDFRFFAVEIDRNTESIERRALDQTSFGRKINGYYNILCNRTYASHWGIPNLSVLTVSVSGAHVANMIGHVKKCVQPAFVERFVFKSDPHFGTNWKVPSGVLGNLLFESGVA